MIQAVYKSSLISTSYVEEVIVRNDSLEPYLFLEQVPCSGNSRDFLDSQE